MNQSSQVQVAQTNGAPQVAKHKSYREYPMIVGFFYWWLRDAPEEILHVSKEIIVYVYSYFSVPLLLRTLFDPWKKDEIDTTNMSLDDIIKVKFANLISRLVGAIVRSITILVGLLIIIGTCLLTTAFFVGFILLPVIFVYLVINGLVRL